MGKAKNKWTKDDYIKAEKKRLAKIFDKLPQNAASAAEKLIDNAAFMAVSLQELQDIINEKGYVEEYQNGANQSGKKKSSAVDTYDKAVNNRLKIIRQLVDLLPRSSAQEQGGEAGELAEFIKNGS